MNYVLTLQFGAFKVGVSKMLDFIIFKKCFEFKRPLGFLLDSLGV